MTLLLPDRPPVLAAMPSVRHYPLASVTYGPEEIAAVVETLMDGWTTCGPRVAAFERAFAEYVGAEDAVMVNSGSTADLLAAWSLGPPRRADAEILVPAVTWPTQVWACTMAGYRVRLVDVDPHTLQVDVSDLKRKLSARTAAVFLVHVLGNVADLDAVRDLAARTGVPILEDACEALGTRWRGRHVGTLGRAGAFSFFFSHLLTTMEGGMVATTRATADCLRLWRSHGWRPLPGQHFHFPTWGMNVRPMEIQGAFGLVQLGKLDGFLAARRRNEARLRNALADYADVLMPCVVPLGCEPGWHAFPLLVSPLAPFSRDEVCAFLGQRGIETRPIIAGNLARQPALARDPRIMAGPLHRADFVHDRGFYLGLASHDDEEGTGYVADVIGQFVESRG